MANLKKVLAYARENGINDLTLHHHVSTVSEVIIENGVHEKTKIDSDSSFTASGAIEGHHVSFHSDTIDNKSMKIMVEAMKSQKDYTRSYDSDLIISRPTEIEYQKNRTYSRSLEKITTEQMIALGEDLAKRLHAIDQRIVNTSITVGVASTTSKFLNSKELSLSSKDNYLLVTVEIVAQDKEELQSDFAIEIVNDIKKINIDKIATKVSDKVLKKLGSKAGVAGTMTVCMTPNAVSPLLSLTLSHLSMFSIDQHLSLLADTLDKKIFSDLLTVEERPNSNNVYAVSYDSEGYPTANKLLVENGVIKTYLYDQEMAKKYSHAPTGNGFGGSNIKPSLSNIYVKGGSATQKDMIKNIEEGYLITSTTGENAGVDAQSGNFTLSASGFYVKNGKIKHPVQQFTISGNVIELYKSILAVGRDSELLPSGNNVPSILFENVVIGC